MAELPLSQTVDATSSERSWRSSILSLLTSTILQGLVIASLIITPLLVAQAMPEPVDLLSLPPFVPLRIEPPVALAPERASGNPKPTSTYKPTLATDELVPPIAIADEIGLGQELSLSDGVADGVKDGLPRWMLDRVAPRAPVAEPEPEPAPVPIGNVKPPRKIVHVNPVYPRVAATARIQGTVELQAIIDANGRIKDLTVVKSIPLLDRAAMEAVQQWRYEPTVLNGRAVPIIMTVEVEFTLR